MDDNQLFDVVVIGAGPGGYVSAIRASQLGLKTAIVDKEWLGGVCLNVGCIPTKALLKNADLVHTLKNRAREFGVSFENLQADFSVAVNRSRQVSKRLTLGVNALMKKNNIEVLMGQARLVAKDKVAVTSGDGSVREISAKNIIIASGAYSMPLPGVTIDGQKVLSYKEAILQTTRPEKVVIIGGGAIGVEFATVWNSYGSQVTIVEMMPHILPNEDEEISAELTKIYSKRGIQVLSGHRFESVELTNSGVKIKVSAEGAPKELEADQVLVAVGFKPNSSDLGLESLGVKLCPRGFIEVDEKMATNVAGLWAIGDVTGKLLLAHVASAQAMVCAEAIAGLDTTPLDYVMMPRAVYSHPQVASFGMTETEAQKKGLETKTARFPFQANGKALGMADYAGFIKIVSEAQTGKLLGAQMIGPDVSELLPELTLAWQNGLTIGDIGHNVHAHPTLSEVIMEAAHAASGHAIHI